jgi:hypothetical protein
VSKENPLAGKETVEEFLKRGGTITEVPRGLVKDRADIKKTKDQIYEEWRKQKI